VAVPRDPHHERGKEERRDQRLDHPKKHVRQNLQVGRTKSTSTRSVWKHPSQRHADDHRDDHPLGL
jgi:hypothetical protein